VSVVLGPRTLSWPTLGLLAIVGPLAAVVGDPDAGVRDRLVWLAIGVIAQVPLTAIYMAAVRLGAGRSRVAVLATVVMGAIARAVTLVIILNAASLDDPLSTGGRIASATLTFVLWGVLLGALVQAWSDYRQTLRALLQRVDRTVNEAEALTAEWQVRLRTASADPDVLATTAETLQSDIERRLRPLSHRLWFGITDRQSRSRYINAFMTDPMPIAWICVIATGLYTWTTTYHFGVAFAFTRAAATNVTVGLILLLSEVFTRSHPRHRVAVRVIAIACAALVPVPMELFVNRLGDPLGLSAIILGLLVIILGSQGIAVGLRMRRSSLYALTAQVDALDAERSAIATHLHSTMQSRWTAAALRLQDAAETGDVDAARRALSDARAVLADSGPAERRPTDLADLAQAWEGIAAIRLHIPADIPEGVKTTLSNVVEEAITNAIRHGKARNVEILVAVAPGAVNVVVTDDGTGLADAAGTGLGSRVLDQVATWSLQSTDQGSILSVSIPCAPE